MKIFILPILLFLSFLHVDASDKPMYIPGNKTTIAYTSFATLTFIDVHCEEFPGLVFKDETKIQTEVKQENIDKINAYFDSLKRNRKITGLDVRMKIFVMEKG